MCKRRDTVQEIRAFPVRAESPVVIRRATTAMFGYGAVIGVGRQIGKAKVVLVVVAIPLDPSVVVTAVGGDITTIHVPRRSNRCLRVGPARFRAFRLHSHPVNVSAQPKL